MRILHCLFSRGFAGTERHVAELASEQARRHDVTLLLAADCRDPRTGADIRAHVAPAVRVRCLPRPALTATLWAELRRQAPDIVHGHLGRATHRLAWLRPDVAMVTTLHKQYRPWPHRPFDAVLCIAGWQRAAVADHHLAVETVHNWTVPCPAAPATRTTLRNALGVAPQTFLFGAAGRLVPEKGFDVLLAAFARAGLDRARLVLFGDGPEEPRLRAMAPPGVIFAGWRPDLKDQMAALDAFLLPSRCEPFGLVLLEAMAAGLPVAASASGGPLEILGSGHPFLVPPGDVAAWTSCLVRLRDAAPVAHDLARFSLPSQARRIERIYEHVIAARAAQWQPLPALG